MNIDIDSIFKEAQEKNIILLNSDIGSNLIYLLTEQQLQSYVITSHKCDKPFNTNNSRVNASTYFNTIKSKFLQEKLRPILSALVSEYQAKESKVITTQEIKKRFDSRGNDENKGLTAKELKNIIESIILDSANNGEVKELLDSMKLYLSKFDISDGEDKNKYKLINIEQKQTKVCAKCGSEIS